MNSTNTQVRVLEAKTRDVGRGIIRIDPDVSSELGISTGDVIEIEGKAKTAAIAWPGYPEDRGKGVARIDGATRKNAGVGIVGIDKVMIRGPIEAKQATRLTFAPTEPLRIQGGEDYLRKLLHGRVLTKGDFISISVMSRTIVLSLLSHSPKADAVIMGLETQVEISETPVKEIEVGKIPNITYEDIGGLEEEIQKVREMIELPLKHPELFQRLGIEPPKGVLLRGPPGTGKTLLAKAVANETESTFYSLSGPEIMSKFYGESEERLRQIFEEAEKNAPSIVFIDEIDSIAPKREEVTGEVERRVVAQLLSLMDGLKARGQVVVIGATNRPNALDPALRRGGRFDREIEIGIPDRNARLEVLQVHTRGMPLTEEVSLEELANVTHGFVGADLEGICKESAMLSLRRVLPKLDLESDSIPAEVLENLVVTQEDFKRAITEVEPSALREVFVELPDVTWDDVGGIKGAKQGLIEAVEWPLKYGKLFGHMEAKAPKGILLYGPPGTGKTLLAKAVAHESEANFISVKGPEFLSKWVGESEKAVRETFRKARQASPCIIFLDEIDSIVPTRGRHFGDSQVTERIISQILTELDGLEELHGVVVIGATNRPDMIDTALLRPGRFDRLIGIGMPNRESRLEIFEIHTRNKPLADDVSLEDLVELTEDLSGAEIAAICQEASITAIRQYIAEGYEDSDKKTEDYNKYVITMEHFEEILKKIKKSEKLDVPHIPIGGRKGPSGIDFSSSQREPSDPIKANEDIVYQ